ncbi:MAG: LysR substrate-binding domain-containing protein [Pseudomonadota bacterium]
MYNLQTLATFVEVARAGSFATAAKTLRVSTSATSKAVLRLEEEIGAKLFNRTTRSVSLTVEGERFLDGAQRLLATAEELSEEFSDSLDNPRGRLVISAPAVFGRKWLTERVLAFMCKYRDVDVELSFEDRQVDLASERIDVAIRIGNLGDSANLVARKLFDDRVHTCASPEYLERRGRPRSLDDLDKHQAIHYRVRNTGRLFPFLFDVDGETERRTLPPALVANSVDAMQQGGEAGIGLVQLPSFLAVEALSEGRLVEVLADVRQNHFPYSIVYLDRRLVPPRIRAFVDFLVADPPRYQVPELPATG